MKYIDYYKSPLGEILLGSDSHSLTELYFKNGSHHPEDLGQAKSKKDLPIFTEARNWLDIYFSGKEPNFIPAVNLQGTSFQLLVWRITATIPYGQTRTYGSIAREIAGKKGLSSMSSQAVGGALGRNPISLVIPCHRVLGKANKLTGYGGGLKRKSALLKLEGADL